MAAARNASLASTRLILSRRLGRLAGAFVAAVAASAACAQAPSGRDLASTTPGTLIRAQPIAGAPAGAAAYKILYRSQGLSGEPIEVSGVVIAPSGVPSPRGRPIVAWAHPTTGVVDRCAPSRARVLFRSIQGLGEMLARGYAVVATDYPGLGTPGPHPYLVGVSEGRAILDSVRAARVIPGVGEGTRFAVWGHSQGGQAAIFTGLLAKSYAPELHLVGVAAAAPATDLATLLSADIDTSGGRNLTAMTLWSWSRVYGAPMERVVTPAAIPVINQLAGLCIERFFDVLIRRGPTQALARSFLAVPDLTAVEPWRTLLERDTPGPLPPEIPVFLAQGTADNLVRPAVTLDYRARLCERGSPVQLLLMRDVGHAFSALSDWTVEASYALGLWRIHRSVPALSHTWAQRKLAPDERVARRASRDRYPHVEP